MSKTGIRGRLSLAQGVLAAALALPMALGVSDRAAAYDEPNVNLGLTSFLDGGLSAGPGFYALQYFQFYTASKLKDQRGVNLTTPKTEASVVVLATQLAYLSSAKIGAASPGLNLVVPWAVSAEADNGLGQMKAKTGAGNATIGPFIQFDPIMGAGGPRFIHRIEFQVLAPLGDYDARAGVQPGANFWSFDPYWAGTLFLTPDWTVSARLHYLWNGQNDRPNYALKNPYPGVVSSRAGQAFHMNFASEYALTKDLRIGVNGYYLQQTTDTEINGSAVPGRKERVAAIGPGLMYSWGPERAFFFNVYKEFDAVNRPEGGSFVLRYAHHF
jgi:hypothetical protein